jgi:uncharacterized protein
MRTVDASGHAPERQPEVAPRDRPGPPSDARGLRPWLLQVARLCGAVGLALALVGAVVVWQEEAFIYFPVRPLVGTPADIGLAYQDVVLTTADGVRVHGWWVPGRTDVTWLWLHGNAGNVSHRLEQMALIHRRLGVNLFILGYRGYGRSEGQPGEQGTYHDADAALAYLRALPEVSADKIVLYGQSLGAAVAVDVAVREPVAGLILEAPFASIPAMARAVYPFLPVWPFLRTRYDSLTKIPEVHAPVLILHSPDDEVVPYQQGRDLFAAAREPKRFYTITGAGHNDPYLRGGAGYWEALAAFVDELR